MWKHLKLLFLEVKNDQIWTVSCGWSIQRISSLVFAIAFPLFPYGISFVLRLALHVTLALGVMSLNPTMDGDIT